MKRHALLSGNTKSCGCRKLTVLREATRIHGEVKTVNGKRVASPEYRAWQNIKERCLNPKNRSYPYYGGRGIQMHAPWAQDFLVFLASVGRRPSPELTLDRTDGSGNYEPGNVRWVSRRVQARNRAYAATKAWVLAESLGVKTMTAHHMIWQVRAKDRGDMNHFQLSAEREAEVRRFLDEFNAGVC